MSGSVWIPALAALWLWWFSTGAILIVVRLADRKGQRARRLAVVFALPVLALGLAGHWITRDLTDTWAVYGAFVAALAIWGWIELAFLTGVITGPNRRPCPANVREWDRFLRAWGTVAHHEVLLAAGLVGYWVTSSGAANSFGFWTFAILFFARISAKLNLFLGLPKQHTEFLPSPLAHLPGYFRVQAMNWLFPVSITALSFASACFLERLWMSQTPFHITGFALLAAITALALIEHWLMVLPVPDQKLWRWMLPDPRPIKTPREDIHGL